MAAAALDRALALNPNAAHAWLAGGSIHALRNEPAEAIEWADRALHDQPRHVPAMRVKVVVLAHLGHLDEARAELSRAASL